MALRILNVISSPTTDLSVSVCIVGAGIAGLIAAMRLAQDKRRRVIGVEIGLRKPEPSLSVLNEVATRRGGL